MNVSKKYSVYVIEVADYNSEVRISKFNIADPIWRPCCYKTRYAICSIKLVIVLMEYIFIHTKKGMITEKNDEMKNLKEKKKLSAKK